VAKRLLVPRTPADLVAWLTLFLMALQILLSTSGREDLSEAEINRLTDHAVERALRELPPSTGGADPGESAAKRPPLPPRKQRAAKAKRRKPQR
jgi:hypothetical protein